MKRVSTPARPDDAATRAPLRSRGNGGPSRHDGASPARGPADMTAKGGPAPAPRRRNAERTRSEILAAAIREFTERGLNGARVDSIAARTRTNKRMIYYYFKSKRQLFIAVLEDAYRRIREAERALRLDDLPPLIAMRLLIEFTCDYHWKHPEFAKLVAIENVQKGRNIARAARSEERRVGKEGRCWGRGGR